jgi:hypothetical protein
MMSARKALIFACTVLMLGSTAAAQGTPQETFESKLYSLSEIKHFNLDPQQFSALGDADKKNLLQARDALVSLFKAIEVNKPALSYVTPELAKKYKDSASLAAGLIEPETSIHAIGVTEFKLLKEGEIRLSFFAVVFSEGTMAVSEKSAILKKIDSGWRVGAFE